MLAKVNISLRDSEGQIRNVSDVLDEVAGRWDTFTINQQNQISTAIAGTRQANYFKAAMQDWDEVLEATDIAMNANGSAMERMGTYTEGLKGKIATFKATWEGFVQGLNLDELIGKVVDLGTGIIELVDYLLNKIPVLSPLIKGLLTVEGINVLAGSVVQFFTFMQGPKGLNGLIGGLITSRQQVKDLFDMMQVAFGGESILKWASNLRILASGTGLAGLVGVITSPVGLIAAVAAAGIAIYKLGDHFGWFTTKTQEAKNKIGEFTNTVNTAKGDFSGVSNELEQINQQISDIQSDGTITLTEQSQLDLLYEQKKELKEQLELKKQILEQSYIEQAMNYGDAQIYDKQGMQETLTRIQKMNEQIAAGGTYYEVMGTRVFQSAEEIAKLRDELIANIEEQHNYDTSILGIADSLTKLGWSEQQIQQALGDTYTAAKETAEYYSGDYARAMDTAAWAKDRLADSLDVEGLQSQIDKQKMLLTENTISEKAYWDNVNSIVESAMSDYVKNLETQIEANKGNQEEQQKYQDAMTGLFKDVVDENGVMTGEYVLNLSVLSDVLDMEVIPAANEAADAFANGWKAMEGNISQIDSIVSAYDTLNEAVYSYNTTGEISLEQLSKLIELDPQYLDCLSMENGQMVINTDTLRGLVDEQYNNAKAAIYQQGVAKLNAAAQEAAADKSKGLGKATRDAIDDINDNASALQNAAISAKLAAAGYDEYQQAMGKAVDAGVDEETINAITAETEAELKALDGLVERVTSNWNRTGTKTGNGGSSGKSPEEQAYETEKSRFELAKQQKELEQDRLENQKDILEIEKDKVELKKSELELEKELKEQELERVEGAEESIEDLLDYVQKMLKQQYEDLKTNLTNVQDTIGSWRDALSAVKDTYGEITDGIKDAMQAEKDAAEQRDALADKATAVSDIQEQLNEIQYDNSASAQEKRLQLMQQLNEAQKELNDESKNQAYDQAVSQLDGAQQEVEKIFDYIDSALQFAEDAIGEYINYISDTLMSDNNLYQEALREVQSAIDGNNEQLLQKLYSWNQSYGDNIAETITRAWEDALDAVNAYKTATGETSIAGIREGYASQGTDLNREIKSLDTQINTMQNEIDNYGLQVDDISLQIDQKKSEIAAVDEALAQLEVNYNSTTLAAQGLTAATQEEINVIRTSVSATQDNTEATNYNTSAIESIGDAARSASGDMEQVSASANATADSLSGADGLATAADNATEAITKLKGAQTLANIGKNGIGESLPFNEIIGNFINDGKLANIISRYGPKLINAGIKLAIGSLHDGTGYVEKANSWLDDMLGLGPDETARVLKVGEAVIPDYANNVAIRQIDRPLNVGRTINNQSSTPIKNNNGISIDMGDMSISGVDSQELKSKLNSMKREFADDVYATINKHISISGHRNVRKKFI